MSGTSAFIEHGKILGEVVHVTVRDDGAGMDAETLTKIFDPFFTTKFAGRGLGLAATRGILDSHEGQLRIETEVGLGSRFTFFLPIQEDARPSSIKADLAVGLGRFGNRDVLVVDDEQPIRTILTKHLSEVGFNVHLASDGKEALAKAAEIGSALSLVVLDITMPGRSGIEIWSELRKTRAELPIIISSGHPEEALEQLDGWNSARDGFIQKPYRNQTLLEEVASLLGPDES
ncbi:MAG TPA: response regulator [Myxococcales bacterium]|nr:response regulator [Myxococcales bacterium]